MKEIIKYVNIKEDKVYLKLSLLFFMIWLLFKGPLRSVLKTDCFEFNTFLGIAPNLFAGITLVFWQVAVTNSKPLLTLVCVNAVLFFSEFIQLFIKTQTADVLDLCASFFGSILAIDIAMSVEKRKRNKDQNCY